MRARSRSTQGWVKERLALFVDGSQHERGRESCGGSGTRRWKVVGARNRSRQGRVKKGLTLLVAESVHGEEGRAVVEEEGVGER